MHSMTFKYLQVKLAVLLCSGIALFALPLAAQQTPRIAVSAGYSFMRFDSQTIGFADYTNLQGANGSLAYNLTPEFRCGCGTGGGIWRPHPCRRLDGRPAGLSPFVGYGAVRAWTFWAVSDTHRFWDPSDQHGASFAGGGGIDIPISARFSLRAIQADFINTQTFSASQNNLRFSTGLVFRWGAVKKNRSARKMPSP